MSWHGSGRCAGSHRRSTGRRVKVREHRGLERAVRARARRLAERLGVPVARRQRRQRRRRGRAPVRRRAAACGRSSASSGAPGSGGGLVLDGRLAHGPRVGGRDRPHVREGRAARRCNCGLRGCVEAYAGRGALEQRARRESAQAEDDALRPAAQAWPGPLTSGDVAAGARRGRRGRARPARRGRRGARRRRSARR